MESKISKSLEEFAEWKLPEEPVAEEAVPHTSTDGTFAGRVIDRQRS